MEKDNNKAKVAERIVAIIIGLIFGVIMSFFISSWAEHGTMKVTQWATLLGLIALVAEQINISIMRLVSTFTLATLLGSMVGATLGLGNKVLLMVAAVTILALAIAMTVIVYLKRKSEDTLWNRINTRMVPEKGNAEEDAEDE